MEIPEQDKKRWISIIHVAKNKLSLDESAYRAILSGAGVNSSSEITTAEEFNVIMLAFNKLGFRYTNKNKKLPILDEQRNNLCTERQRYYIKGLWELASRTKDESSLKRIIKRIGGVDDLRFLTKKKASSVILALRDIAWKAGYNPDSPYASLGGDKS